MRHFIERDILILLRESRCLEGARIEIGTVGLGSNRVWIELRDPQRPGKPLVLAFEEQSGWLVSSVTSAGWLADLGPSQREALADALAGLYKLSGVDLVREQIARCLGQPTPPYDIAEPGLVVWPGGRYETEVLYDFRDGPRIAPRCADPAVAQTLPTLQADRILFSRIPISWTHWVEVWSLEAEHSCHAHPVVDDVRLLPLDMDDPGSHHPPMDKP